MSKRSLFVRLVPCRCLRGEEETVTSLDYSHCSLETVPKEIFSFEKTLQELYLDANQIEELPKVRRTLMYRNMTFLLCRTIRYTSVVSSFIKVYCICMYFEDNCDI